MSLLWYIQQVTFKEASNRIDADPAIQHSSDSPYMQFKPSFKHPFFFIITILLLLPTLNACDVQFDNNIPGVPPEGRYVVIGANQHSGIPNIQVAFAMFEDGEPVDLLGGDVVQASTTDDSILLLDKGVYNGSYVAALPNENNLNQIDLQIIHEPLKTRESRWYPTDLLYIDAGPGEFVGASASVTLPPEPLNLSSTRITFSNINDAFVLNWSPEAVNTTDTMIVRSAVSCSDGTTIYNYGTIAALIDNKDDGVESITMEQFIYDTKDQTPPPFEFLLSESRAALQELLTWLGETERGEGFFNTFTQVNPIENSCEVRLFLFREREGNFNASETNGRIFSSRSADITLQYIPATLTQKPE